MSCPGSPLCRAIDASESEAGLPDDLWRRIEHVHINGGVEELDNRLRSNEEISQRVASTLDEARRLLQEEEDLDRGYRRQYGPQWTCTPAEALTHELNEQVDRYSRLVQQARQSDAIVREKLQSGQRQAMQRLLQSREQLSESVPRGGAISGDAERVREELKEAIVQLHRCMDARQGLIKAIREAVPKREAIRVLMHAGGGSGSLSEENKDQALTTLDQQRDDARAALQENMQQQDRELERVGSLKERFDEVRHADDRTKGRGAALQELMNAVNCYEEVLSNLREGEGFYSELMERVQGVHTHASDLKMTRDMERQDLLMHLGHGSGGGAAAGAGESRGGGPSRGSYPGLDDDRSPAGAGEAVAPPPVAGVTDQMGAMRMGGGAPGSERAQPPQHAYPGSRAAPPGYPGSAHRGPSNNGWFPQ